MKRYAKDLCDKLKKSGSESKLDTYVSQEMKDYIEIKRERAHML